MGARNKKKYNLLKMPNHERLQLIKEVRERLRQRVTEAKLWQSLLEAEDLTINGSIVCRSNQPLHGLTLKEAICKYG